MTTNRSGPVRITGANANGNGNAVLDEGQQSTVVGTVTAVPGYTDAAKHDYRLLTGSAYIDAGATTVTAPTDAEGTVRPQGAAPDIGAYEAAGAPAPIPPPTTGHTQGVLLPALTETLSVVSHDPAVLQSVVCTNPTGDRVYVQVFN